MNNPQRTRQELQDDIDCYRILVKSLSNLDALTAEQEEEKEEYQSILNNLVNEMQNLSSSQSAPPRSNSYRPGKEIKCERNDRHNHLDQPTRTASTTSLKRSRAEFERGGVTARKSVKSRRSTPDDSRHHSDADSIGSGFFDHEIDLISDDEVKKDIVEAIRRERLLREDIEFARQLATSFEQADHTDVAPTNNRNPRAVYNQATFQSDGSFSRQSQSNIPLETSAGALTKREANNHDSGVRDLTNDDGDDSDGELDFIDAQEWLRSASRNVPIRTSYPSSFHTTIGRMPGAFPNTFNQDFTSMPGSSVYRHRPWNQTIGNVPSYSFSMDSPFGTAGNPYTIEQLESLALSRGPNHPLQDYPVENAQTQEEIRQLLSNIRPDEELTASELAIQPRGLKVKLMPHQIRGLAWMTKMEIGSNKGGILADDMGLGKTVQAISIMLTRPPPDNAKRPTLIVAPVALVDQWKRELTKLVHPNQKFTIFTMHGPASRTVRWEDIKHYDVIMTTYGTLGQEMKRALQLQAKLKLNPDARIGRKEDCAILGERSIFHRVILDEAQHIKNRHTQNAKAVCKVRAEYRWCLSGTPMQNNVEEIFSYIQFCRIRPYCVWDKFARDIARPVKSRMRHVQDSSLEKLQALLKAILLRRTKKSKIDGQSILQLPEKRVVEERAIFSEDQLRFYKALEEKTRIEFNRYVKAGTVGRNYSHALVLLLRLRQCCCSPQLVVNSADFVTEGGIEGLDLVDNARKLTEDVVRRLKQQDNQECPICMDAVDNMMIFSTCGHMVCTEDFAKLVDSVGQDGTSDVKCPHCRAKIDTKTITDQISFKQVYLGAEDHSQEQNDFANDSEDDSNDDTDGDDYSTDESDDDRDLRDFVVPDDQPLNSDESDDEYDDDLDLPKLRREGRAVSSARGLPPYRPPGFRDEAVVKSEDEADGTATHVSAAIPAEVVDRAARNRKKKRRSKKKKQKQPHKSLADLRKESLRSRAAKRRYLKQLSKIYEPCAKIDRTLALLADIQENDSAEKTIIFSSFTSFLDLLEVPLSRDPILNNYTRYDGSMTAKDRNAAVLRFTDDPNCKAILVSLKAGNAGLNLTAANHVIILDPFWNPFVEYQAADRCHRIGQRREVTVHRVLIGQEGYDYEQHERQKQIINPDPEDLEDNFHMFTVEDRILALQEKKRRLVESALDEEESANVGRLGVRELGYLFGVNAMPG